jgi:hypothetical protein
MIINVWEGQKDAEQGRWAMSIMCTMGIAPDIIIYNTLAVGYCK